MVDFFFSRKKKNQIIFCANVTVTKLCLKNNKKVVKLFILYLKQVLVIIGRQLEPVLLHDRLPLRVYRQSFFQNDTLRNSLRSDSDERITQYRL